MPLTLQIITGANAGKRIVLRDGQLATFGRTAWADFSFPADEAFADIHFRVEQRNGQWFVHDLQSGKGTWVNDAPVDRVVLQTGQVLRAGATSFRVVLGNDLRAASEASVAAAAAPVPPAAPIREWLDRHPRVKLSSAGVDLAGDSPSFEAFAESLQQHKAWADLVRFLAHYLPLPSAVAWGCQVLQGVVFRGQRPLSEAEKEALSAAESWCKSPGEKERTRAAAAAEVLAHETAAAWLAAAAGWSGGSLAPPDAPALPPPDHLPHHAVDVSVTLALAMIPAAQRPDMQASAAATGRKLLADGGRKGGC